MRLRNILIVVKDIERSKKFYHDLFGLDIVLDTDGRACAAGGEDMEGFFRENYYSGKQFV